MTSRWTLYRFSLPLSLPRGQKEGLILELNNRFAEISPLAGRSQESLDQAKHQLLKHLKSPEKSLYPSVAFGWEYLNSWLSPQAAKIPVAALLLGTPQEIMDKAETVYAQGYTTVKVKISQLQTPDAQTVLKELIPYFRIRVDVNRSWSFDQSLLFFSHFDPQSFEFIEEPTADLEKLTLFTHPFALDESLLELSLDTLATYPQLKALVIKPTLIGGKQRCLHFQQIANTLQIPLIFSSTYESGLGILQICALSLQMNVSHIPLGLDTYRFLSEDLLLEPLNFSRPFLTLPHPSLLKTHLLQKIAHG